MKRGHFRMEQFMSFRAQDQQQRHRIKVQTTTSAIGQELMRTLQRSVLRMQSLISSIVTSNFELFQLDYHHSLWAMNLSSSACLELIQIPYLPCSCLENLGHLVRMTFLFSPTWRPDHLESRLKWCRWPLASRILTILWFSLILDLASGIVCILNLAIAPY